MCHQYQRRIANDEDLDRMLAEADAAQSSHDRNPRFVAVDGDVADDDGLNEAVLFVLEDLADGSRDEHGRPLDGYDLLRVATTRGLVLGTVFGSSRRPHRVIELDYDRCTDAIACAVIADLPRWVAYRYEKVVLGTWFG